MTYPERFAARRNGAPMAARQRSPWWLRCRCESCRIMVEGPFVCCGGPEFRLRQTFHEYRGPRER